MMWTIANLIFIVTFLSKVNLEIIEEQYHADHRALMSELFSKYESEAMPVNPDSKIPLNVNIESFELYSVFHQQYR